MSHWIRGRNLVYNPIPKQVKPPRRFRFGRILLTALRRTCTAIGALVLILSVLGVWSASKMADQRVPQLPDNMVLTFDYHGSLPETSPVAEYAALFKDVHLSIDDLIDAIDKGAKDKRVKALAFRASGGGYQLSQIQAIRAAVQRFKETGKKTYIYAESFGEGGYGLGLYNLASVFDEIWMQPVGTVAIGGLNLEAPYFKKVMDKYGIKAEFFHRKEYKNAMENITSDRMSGPSREMMTQLINDLASQLIGPVKKDRPQLSDSFETLVDLGLINDQAALKAGLIDRLDYEDVLFDELQAKLKDAQAVGVADYWTHAKHKMLEKRMMEDKPATVNGVAVIHINGMIVSGSPDASPYGIQENMAGADDIVGAIHEAGENPAIRAIVLRIDSPGGSPTASESIHRAVEWAQTRHKKKVVVSMGNLAASGGYWVASGADRIYAMEATLTGSIGVVGGKINAAGLWNKLDVNWDGIKYGKNSSMMSPNSPFSPSEQAQFEATLDSTYAAFINHVAKGRKMTVEQAEAVAKGRVWTGRQALKAGLVDEIGGLDTVLDQLAKDYKVGTRDKLTITHLPAPTDTLELLLQMLSAEVGVPEFLKHINVLSYMHNMQAYVYDPMLNSLQIQ